MICKSTVWSHFDTKLYFSITLWTTTAQSCACPACQVNDIWKKSSRTLTFLLGGLFQQWVSCKLNGIGISITTKRWNSERTPQDCPDLGESDSILSLKTWRHPCRRPSMRKTGETLSKNLSTHNMLSLVAVRLVCIWHSWGWRGLERGLDSWWETSNTFIFTLPGEPHWLMCHRSFISVKQKSRKHPNDFEFSNGHNPLIIGTVTVKHRERRRWWIGPACRRWWCLPLPHVCRNTICDLKLLNHGHETLSFQRWCLHAWATMVGSRS